MEALMRCWATCLQPLSLAQDTIIGVPGHGLGPGEGGGGRGRGAAPPRSLAPRTQIEVGTLATIPWVLVRGGDTRALK